MLARRDAETMVNKPWLFQGVVGESAPRFQIAYGKQGLGTLLEIWKDYPRGALRILARSNGLFWLRGSGFAFLSTYEPQHTRRPLPLRIAGMAIAPLLLFGSLSALGWLVYGAFCITRPSRLPNLTPQHQVLVGLSILLMGCAVPLNALTCCENERFFVGLWPLALIIGTATVGALWTALTARRIQ
jgi:hypothetical protein